MAESQRAYARVETFLRAMVRLADSPDAPLVFSGGFGADDTALDLAGSNLPEPLVNYLLALERKLDTIMGLLSREDLKESFPIPAEVFEISGSGALFSAEHAFREGDHVEIVFVLGQFPLRMAGALARVSQPRQAHGRQVWGLDFLRIREPDLDAIIRFVFHQERQHIREIRWE